MPHTNREELRPKTGSIKSDWFTRMWWMDVSNHLPQLIPLVSTGCLPDGNARWKREVFGDHLIIVWPRAVFVLQHIVLQLELILPLCARRTVWPSLICRSVWSEESNWKWQQDGFWTVAQCFEFDCHWFVVATVEFIGLNIHVSFNWSWQLP